MRFGSVGKSIVRSHPDQSGLEARRKTGVVARPRGVPAATARKVVTSGDAGVDAGPGRPNLWVNATAVSDAPAPQ